MNTTIRTCVLALTLSTALASPAMVRAGEDVILMISDGIGFNGWLAADYFQGLPGQQH